MAKNIKSPISGHKDSFAVSHPAAPSSGQPCRCGNLPCVALTDERSDGTTTVAYGSFTAELSVKGHDGAINAPVALYDLLYYSDAVINDGSGPLNVDTTKVAYGLALETVVSGATATIKVLVLPNLA